MLRSEQGTSAPNTGRHRTLIAALFGDTPDPSVNLKKNPDKKEKFEWTWDNEVGNDFVELLNGNRDVKFHRNFSSGTAVVRGSQPMSNGQHFWEVKMISPVYGTDMMIGVGTHEADTSQVHEKFISLLGMDNQTWGLSYTGLFRHNGESKDYSTRFGQGCVIGVHLDMWNGTLSFYKNKKYLGVASRGLKGKTLYAMASSTAACSSMRILRSCSFPSSLQFLCCTRLRELIPDEKNVIKSVQLPPGLHLFLENNLSWLLGSRYQEANKNKHGPAAKRLSNLTSALHPTLLGDFFLEDVNNDNDMAVTSGDERLVGAGNRPIFTLYNCSRFGDRDSGPTSLGNRFGEELAPTAGPQTSNDEDNSYSRWTFRPVESEPNSMEDSEEESNPDDEEDKPDIDPAAENNKDDDTGNEAKRCRYSYNYVMGLSDPDSD